MESQLQRYARRLVEEQLGHSRLQLAQIADDISTVKTEQDTKFTGDQEKTHLIRDSVGRTGSPTKGNDKVSKVMSSNFLTNIK